MNQARFKDLLVHATAEVIRRVLQTLASASHALPPSTIRLGHMEKCDSALVTEDVLAVRSRYVPSLSVPFGRCRSKCSKIISAIWMIQDCKILSQGEAVNKLAQALLDEWLPAAMPQRTWPLSRRMSIS